MHRRGKGGGIRPYPELPWQNDGDRHCGQECRVGDAPPPDDERERNRADEGKAVGPNECRDTRGDAEENDISPARVIRTLDDAQVQKMGSAAKFYVANGPRFTKGLKRIG